MKISLISNVGLDSLIRKLSKVYEVYPTQGFNTWLTDLLDINSPMYQFRPQCVFILLDGAELKKLINSGSQGKDNVIEKYTSYLVNAAQAHSDIDFFISDIDYPQDEICSIKNICNNIKFEFDWKQSLLSINSSQRNIYVFPLKELVEFHGRKDFYSRKTWYLAGMIFSMMGEDSIVEKIKIYLSTYTKSRKKCLILDLDNTLWGGVLGEDGAENIVLSNYGIGAIYKDFQRRLKELKGVGVILAVASKNNLSDVEEVFNVNNEFILSLDDFSIKKINWKQKSLNIENIIDELNITEDSVVFLDDSPVEREEVKSAFNNVIVPEFPGDISQLLDVINTIYEEYFINLYVTDDDKKRTEMYHENKQRNNLKLSSETYHDYLMSLNQHIEISLNKNIDRVFQLIQKTNQFNLTTKRYSMQELNDLYESKQFHVFFATVSDKFGDNGVVSVIILKSVDDAVMEVDSFLLSCRVMSRFIEFKLLEYILYFIRDLGYSTVIGKFRATKKNMPACDFYNKSHFNLNENESENGTKEYEFNLSDLKNTDVIQFSTIRKI